MTSVRRTVAASTGSALLVIGAILVPRVLSYASDHLDTPTVIADPAADIGDIYAWTAPDGRHLNLVMDIVAHRFSDRLQYVFHVESGQQFGRTTAATPAPAANGARKKPSVAISPTANTTARISQRTPSAIS